MAMKDIPGEVKEFRGLTNLSRLAMGAVIGIRVRELHDTHVYCDFESARTNDLETMIWNQALVDQIKEAAPVGWEPGGTNRWWFVGGFHRLVQQDLDSVILERLSERDLAKALRGLFTMDEPIHQPRYSREEIEELGVDLPYYTFAKDPKSDGRKRKSDATVDDAIRAVIKRDQAAHNPPVVLSERKGEHMQQWRNDYADITLRNGERFTLLIYGEPADQERGTSGKDHERVLIETAINPIFTGVYAKDDDFAGEVMPPMLECQTLPPDNAPELMVPAVIRREDISSVTLRYAIEEEEKIQ